MALKSDGRLSVEWQRLIRKWLLTFGLLTLFFGTLGLLCVYRAREWTLLVFDLVGMFFFSNISKTPPEKFPFTFFLSTAYLTAVVTTFLGILYFLVGVYQETAREGRLRRFIRRARTKRSRNVVICGLGRVGRQLVKDICDLGQRQVIAIEIDETNPRVEECWAQGAAIVIGDARQRIIHQNAHVQLAEQVFIVAGNDSVNLDIAEDIRSWFEEQEDTEKWNPGRQPLNCYTNVLGHTLAQAAERGLTSTKRVTFHIFNTDESAARQLLLHPDWGLARAPASRRFPCYVPHCSDEVAYYIVIGFGSMGQMVALQAARLAHFANLKRLRMTLVDRFEADKKVQLTRREFLDRHPGFCPEKLDLDTHVRSTIAPDEWHSRSARPAHREWLIENDQAVEYAVNAEFLDLETVVDSPALLSRLLKRIQPPRGPSPRVAVILCLEEDRQNFEAALRLKSAVETLHADRSLKQPFPIYAYLPDEKGLWNLLARRRDDQRFPIFPFGRREDVANYEEVTQSELRRMAAAIHDYYQKTSRSDPQIPFESLDPAFKASNQDAAAHGDIKLDVLGWSHRRLKPDETAPSAPEFAEGQIELLAQIEHNRWLGERLSSGWRYGEPNREIENKRRLTFVPWEELTDADERAKDERHVRALVSMYEELGYAVIKAK